MIVAVKVAGMESDMIGPELDPGVRSARIDVEVIGCS